MKEEISLGELIVLALKFTKKNLPIFLIAIVIGIGVGYFKESRVIPKHKSEAVICSDILDGQRMQEIISEFETAAKTGNSIFLSEKLGITIDSAKTISSIEIERIESETTYRSDVDLTKIKTHQCIRITCTAVKPGVFNSLQNAILSLLSNHSETKSIVDHRKNAYVSNIEKIKKDINFISKQRELIYEKLQSGNSKIDINQFDNQGQFIIAYQKVTDLEELLLRTKAVILIKPFNTLTVASHSKTGGIIKTLLMFFFLSIVVAIFREIKL